MEDRGELCLEEEVERMRRAGKSVDEIAEKMGVDQTWVEQLFSQWFPGEQDRDQRPSR